MKGLEKFKEQINEEVKKVKDAKKQALIREEANEIIKYIENVCNEEYDNLLAQDHKSFERMRSFIMEKAKECAVNNSAMIRSDKVFGWIDEYVKLDDKAQVEAEKKKKEKKTYTPVKTVETSTKEESKQISIFDMF